MVCYEGPTTMNCYQVFGGKIKGLFLQESNLLSTLSKITTNSSIFTSSFRKIDHQLPSSPLSFTKESLSYLSSFCPSLTNLSVEFSGNYFINAIKDEELIHSSSQQTINEEEGEIEEGVFCEDESIHMITTCLRRLKIYQHPSTTSYKNSLGFLHPNIISKFVNLRSLVIGFISGHQASIETTSRRSNIENVYV